jgi:hypothetical protein
MVELYLHSSMCLHGEVLHQISIGTTLPFYLTDDIVAELYDDMDEQLKKELNGCSSSTCLKGLKKSKKNLGLYYG